MTIEVRIFLYEKANSLRIAFFLGLCFQKGEKRLLLTLLSKGRDDPPSRKRHEHHSDRVWFLVPHAREKNEYLKTVYAYDQEAKKNGLNLVKTSKENKLF